ncbi:hypothetical protein MYU51_000101 [Penicillium brevicompactum]
MEVNNSRQTLLRRSPRMKFGGLYNGAAIEAEVPVRTRGSLTAEFMKLLHYNDALAILSLKLLDLYFCLWEYYIIKSAEKIRLEEEQR